MTDKEREFRQTYPCLTCLAMKGNDGDVKEQMRQQFRSMHCLPADYPSLTSFLQENSYLPESIPSLSADKQEDSVSKPCYEVFIDGKDVRDTPCCLCARSPRFINYNFSKEERLIARMLRSPRIFFEHFGYLNPYSFRSRHMFVYTGGTERPAYAVLPLFMYLAEAVKKTYRSVEFSDSVDQSIERTMNKIRMHLVNRFHERGYAFSYSDLEPVVLQILGKYENTAFDQDSYELLDEYYREISNKNQAAAKARAVGGVRASLPVTKPWEIPVPGLILMDRRKVKPFRKPLDENTSAVIMDDIKALMEYCSDPGDAYVFATLPCEGGHTADESVHEEREDAHKAAGGSNAGQAASSSSKSRKSPQKASGARVSVAVQASFFDSMEPTEKSESAPNKETISSQDTGSRPNIRPQKRPDDPASDADTSDTELDELITTGYEDSRSGSKSPEKREGVNPSPAAPAGKQAASDSVPDKTPHDQPGPAGESSKPQDDQDSSSAASADEKQSASPYALYVGGTRRCAKGCTRTASGAIDLSIEDPTMEFPPFDSSDEVMDFLHHVFKNVEWFSIEYADRGTDRGIILLTGGGLYAGFIREDLLTKTICKVLFASQTPKAVYTQSLPYLYSQMKRHGLYNTHHLVSLPALFYADEQWSPFSSYPDYEMYDLLETDAQPAGKTLMDLLTCYETIYLSLSKRNETGQRKIRVTASRYRHYELALGTMRGMGRYPGCAWYPKEAGDEELASFDDRGIFFELRLKDALRRNGKPLCEEEHFYFLMGVAARIQRECFSKYPVNLVTMKSDYLVYYLPTKSIEDRAYFENLATGEFAHVKRDMRTDPPAIKLAFRHVPGRSE